MSTAPQISRAADHDTVSKEPTKVGWKMKPELSNNKSSKENTSSPVIAAVEGGFHTQFLLFTRNDVASGLAAAKAAFLLKVHSNCCWDSIRPRILEMISRHCPDNTVYPPLQQMHIDGFLVEILPKSDCPETLPPDAQKKLMSRTLHPICIRVTVDHSVISTPLCTSLATGLSAFTKLKMNFPSEKSYRNIESPQSAVEKRGNVLPQMSTSSSFVSFPSRALKLGPISQSSAATVTSGLLEKSQLQMARPTNSVHHEPAVSQSLENNFSLTTTSDGNTKPPLSDITDCSRPPVPLIISPVTEASTSTASNMHSFTTSDMTANESSETLHSSTCDDIPAPVMVLPLSAFSSEFSSLPTTDSSEAQKSPKSLLLPITVPKSEKITENILLPCSKDAGSPTVKSDPLCTTSHTVCEATAEAIVVDEDDILPSDTSVVQLPATCAGATISCVQSSSVQLSAAHLHSSVSAAVQNVNMLENSTLPDQSVNDFSILSRGASHPDSLAAVSKNDVFADPVTSFCSLSVNTACSQPASCQQSLLIETGMQTISSTPGSEHADTRIERDIKLEQNENVECSASAAELVVTGSHVSEYGSPTHLPEDAETAAQRVCTQQSVVHKVDASSLICCTQMSEDAKHYTMAEQKHADNGHQSHDLECLSVASSSADEVVRGAASSGSHLPLPSAELDELKPMDYTEPSSVAVSQRELPYPADSRDAPVLEDNIMEIVESDEVRTSWLKVKCLKHITCIVRLFRIFLELLRH